MINEEGGGTGDVRSSQSLSSIAHTTPAISSRTPHQSTVDVFELRAAPNVGNVVKFFAAEQRVTGENPGRRKTKETVRRSGFRGMRRGRPRAVKRRFRRKAEKSKSVNAPGYVRYAVCR